MLPAKAVGGHHKLNSFSLLFLRIPASGMRLWQEMDVVRGWRWRWRRRRRERYLYRKIYISEAATATAMATRWDGDGDAEILDRVPA